MKIQVSVEKGAAPKKKGDLLETFTKKFLEILNYEVLPEVRGTGSEIDLDAVSKANRSKTVYVECKAYDDDPIQSVVIKNLIAVQWAEDYNEAWLVTTSPLGKDAKQLVKKIEDDEEKSKKLTFYTPEKLVEAFVNANVILDLKYVKRSISEILRDSNFLGEGHLLISEYGNFWAIECLKGGKAHGVMFTYADSVNVIGDQDLLDNLKKLDTSFSGLDFYRISRQGSSVKILTNVINITDLPLETNFLNHINDLEVKFDHPRKKSLNLNDIFIFPDLEDILNDKSKRVNSEDLLKLDNGNSRALIIGEDLSGKTSLAFTLLQNFNRKKLIPIYFLAEEIRAANLTSFKGLLVKKFKEQYSREQLYIDEFEKILVDNPAKILLLIDDFESFGIKKESAQGSFFQMIDEKFKYVFIFANKSIEIEVTAKSRIKELFEGFKKYRILQLGFVRRDQLVEKWLSLDMDKNQIDFDNDFVSKKDEISQKIKLATGANFLPTFPLYVLTIIQMIESGNRVRAQLNSYGDLYQYLIAQSLLAAKVRSSDLDFFLTYLSFLAHSFYERNVKVLSQEDLTLLYREYSAEMDIDKSFVSVHRFIQEAKILKSEAGYYSFNHNYSYYYFVAKYLSDNFSLPEIRSKVDGLISSLQNTEHANIIIFLIHHSKNKEIIDQIILEAKKLFKGVLPYTLSDKDLAKINSSIQHELVMLIDEPDPKSHRKRELEIQDEYGQVKIEDKAEDLTERSPLNLYDEVNLAFKLMEILGQISNSYYGSINGEKKADLGEEIYSLGFRSLRALLEDFEDYTESIKKEVEKVADKKKVSSEKDKETIANEIIFRFVQLMILIFIKRISENIATRNLFPTTEKIVLRVPTFATKLTNFAVKMNFASELNAETVVSLDEELSKNQLVRELLRLLVIEHFYKFDVKVQTRQKIFDKLGIKLKKSDLVQLS